jgi:hypothetical protein
MECWVVSSVLVSTTNGDVMKIFLAGERRAIGSHLVPELVAGRTRLRTPRIGVAAVGHLEDGVTP